MLTQDQCCSHTHFSVTIVIDELPIPLLIETLTVARDPRFSKQFFELSLQYVIQQIAPSKVQ